MNILAASDRSQHGSRFDYEGDEIVRQMISPEDLGKSPEEYAARHAHEWGLFSFHLCQFHDPALGAWVRRFAAIFASQNEREYVRKKFLTPDEIADVCLQEADGL